MSVLNKLKSVRTLPQLAQLLGIKADTLSYALYWMPEDDKYQTFTVPKKNGGQRAITAPKSRLKFIQSRLAVLLSNILTELEFSRTSKYCVLSHGFKKNFSIVTNAECHRNKRFVFNVDVKDFFPTINFGRVFGFFNKDRNFGLTPKIATIIAQIACYKNELPQGSPCSPVISNFIAHIMDLKINKIATAGRCTYTRYADDMTFSTNEKEFPSSIARLVRGSVDKWVAGDGLLACVYRSGFKLNDLKTRMQICDSRQDVTGLIVNRKINVRQEYYKQARAMCHHLFSEGYLYTKHLGKTAAVSDAKLEGMLSHIYHIRRLKVENFKKDQKSFSELYARFLDYRSFHGIARPRIICEGKTDAIYLKSAMKSLPLKFPRLINPAAKQPLLVDFFNYTPTSALFQDLSGGGDELNKLLSTYRSRISSFKQPPLHPVIILVDNDSGSTKIFKHLSNILGKTIGGTEPYYYAYANLYVVPVPKVGLETAIEDLFSSSLLSRKIDGRSFDRSGKEKDGSKWYGKFEFATKIVRAERKTIDFSGFEPLLIAFTSVMDDYSKRLLVGGSVAKAA